MHIRALFISIATPLLLVAAIDRWPHLVETVAGVMRSALGIAA